MRPVMGARLTCTSNTDMKIETCLVRPGQISPSGPSLICTTVPSAGGGTPRGGSLPAGGGAVTVVLAAAGVRLGEEVNEEEPEQAETDRGKVPLHQQSRHEKDDDGD